MMQKSREKRIREEEEVAGEDAGEARGMAMGKTIGEKKYFASG